VVHRAASWAALEYREGVKTERVPRVMRLLEQSSTALMRRFGGRFAS
jgi:hypothetical protein